MSEYINRKTALENIRKIYELGGFPTGRDAFEVINNVLASIPADDVEKVRHGEWEKRPITSVDDADISLCSLCHYPVNTMWKRTKFCPRCGAKMDKGDYNGIVYQTQKAFEKRSKNNGN